MLTEDVSQDKLVSLRCAASEQFLGNGHGFLNVHVPTTKCLTKICMCHKYNVLFNSKCHQNVGVKISSFSNIIPKYKSIKITFYNLLRYSKVLYCSKIVSIVHIIIITYKKCSRYTKSCSIN